MKYKKEKLQSFLAVIAIGISGVSQASLIDRGGGMIYDTVLDITWLQDANYALTSGYLGVDSEGSMNLSSAKGFVENLSYGGYTDWRLPTVSPVNGVAFQTSAFGADQYNGTKDVGYNITSPNAELSYMFYVTLGNLGIYGTNGTSHIENGIIADGYGLVNTGPFYNLTGDARFLYDGPTSSTSFYFSNLIGLQGYRTSLSGVAWAVRDGDVTALVPIPAGVWLMGSGLLGLIRWRNKQ